MEALIVFCILLFFCSLVSYTFGAESRECEIGSPIDPSPGFYKILATDGRELVIVQECHVEVEGKESDMLCWVFREKDGPRLYKMEGACRLCRDDIVEVLSDKDGKLLILKVDTNKVLDTSFIHRA